MRHTSTLESEGVCAQPKIFRERQCVCFGSWLCKNAAALRRRRMSISPSVVLVVKISQAYSAAIDFGKLFSSSFDFLSFHTSRVKNGPDALEMGCLRFPDSELRTSREVRFGAARAQMAQPKAVMARSRS